MLNGLLETFPYDITFMSRCSYLKEFVRLNSKHFWNASFWVTCLSVLSMFPPALDPFHYDDRFSSLPKFLRPSESFPLSLMTSSSVSFLHPFLGYPAHLLCFNTVKYEMLALNIWSDSFCSLREFQSVWSISRWKTDRITNILMCSFVL